jgi:hypothetical protein
MESINGKTIAVWFSCGAASAVAAKLTIEKYGAANTVRVLNNPVAEEDEDNQRFLRDVEKWISVKIERVINPYWPNASAVEVWNAKKFMASPYGAPCTLELKKKARQAWEKENHADYIVLGFTADEKARHERFILTERKNVLPVLIDAGITKQRCFEIVLSAGIALPRVYAFGYPNANCIGCVKAASPTYWNLVREKHPAVFAARAKQSRAIGAKLVKINGKRVFLDELTPSDKGRPLKNYTFECGIFCEEK